MPVLDYFTYVGTALLALLFVSGAYLGDAGESRFDGALYESATYAPRAQQATRVAELRVSRDALPADHVKEVFGQFEAGDGRRVRR